MSLGDAASWDFVDDRALRAQNIDQYPGKILRITTSGAGVPSNPFWNGEPNAIRSKVWAYGLRNPFRMALRPGTNIPYVGDVGWDAFEEIDVATAGANFGWPCYEGTGRQPGYESKPACQSLYGQGVSAVENPLISSPHTGSAAIVGGPFTPATSSFPTAYQAASSTRTTARTGSGSPGSMPTATSWDLRPASRRGQAGPSTWPSGPTATCTTWP